MLFYFFNDTATTEIYTYGHTLSLHDALPILHTPLFSDYAEKHRLIWVPPGQQASTAADGHIDFPIGSLIVKSFGWPEQNGGRPVETRLLKIGRASCRERVCQYV